MSLHPSVFIIISKLGYRQHYIDYILHISVVSQCYEMARHKNIAARCCLAMWKAFPSIKILKIHILYDKMAKKKIYVSWSRHLFACVVLAPDRNYANHTVQVSSDCRVVQCYIACVWIWHLPRTTDYTKTSLLGKRLLSIGVNSATLTVLSFANTGFCTKMCFVNSPSISAVRPLYESVCKW